MLTVSDFSSFPDGGDGELAEVSLLYGRTAVRSFGHASISTGLSVLGEGPNSVSLDYTVGLPLIAEVGLESSVIELGLHAYGILNTTAPLFGVALFVQLGWMPHAGPHPRTPPP